MSAKGRIGLREIPFGFNDWDVETVCIYCTGHIDPVKFLEMVRSFSASDAPRLSKRQRAARGFCCLIMAGTGRRAAGH
jgi:hypothetical protein